VILLVAKGDTSYAGFQQRLVAEVTSQEEDGGQLSLVYNDYVTSLLGDVPLLLFLFDSSSVHQDDCNRYPGDAEILSGSLTIPLYCVKQLKRVSSHWVKVSNGYGRFIRVSIYCKCQFNLRGLRNAEIYIQVSLLPYTRKRI
jgi:hypothetical protein